MRTETELVLCALATWRVAHLLVAEDGPGDIVVKLRALWSLYAIGAADEAFLRAQLRHPNEHLRTGRRRGNTARQWTP